VDPSYISCHSIPGSKDLIVLLQKSSVINIIFPFKLKLLHVFFKGSEQVKQATPSSEVKRGKIMIFMKV